jgi:mono/diheme cytochrome c family protein
MFRRPLLLTILFLLSLPLLPGQMLSRATAEAQFDDLIAQGEYLAMVSGCIECHTDFKAEYLDFANLTLEQGQTLAFALRTAQDDDIMGAGGRVFDLGPIGLAVSGNITPDTTTGIGAWSDAEIERSIRKGISRDGRRLLPIMPYYLYNNMADADMKAVIAYLRSLPAVYKDVANEQNPAALALAIPPDTAPATAPAPADTAARGRYLMTAILPCTDCHTPIDPNTGQPQLDRYLGGGLPFEGPWGIVYAGNLSPHEGNGLGKKSDDAIKRAIIAGVSTDGRRAVVMPWQIFSFLTPNDLDAVVYYLRHEVTAVDNEVPPAALRPDFLLFVETTQAAKGSNNYGFFAGISALFVFIVIGGMIMIRQRRHN